MNKFIVLVYLVMVVVGCTSQIPPIKSKPITKHIGWFYGDCLAIKAPSLPAGTIVTLIDAEATENTHRSRIIAPAKNSDECQPLAEDRKNVNTEGGKSFYLISKAKAVQGEGVFNFGIAVVLVGKNEPASNSETLDLNNDGIRDSYSFCSTSEGISFEVWSATPYKSKSIWNGYYYLGYDIDSNCP